MRQILAYAILIMASYTVEAQQREIARCGNEFMTHSDLGVQELFTNNRTTGTNGTVYRIPVVFHILTDQTTDVSNISDCIIQNQITILNNCFRRKAGAPNTNAAGADAEIEFYLARKNNTGAAITGINRVTTTNCNYTTLNSSTQISAIRTAAGVPTNWPVNKYLNIFVLKTMPNSNRVRGQAWYGGSNMGVFVHYSYVGSKNSGCSNLTYLDITGFKAYDLGMTVVHEVGHYLNLLHTFDNCTPGDGCADTPPVSGVPNALCGTDNNTKGLCSGATSRQWQNYLDYTDDACMDRFTPCQVLRMRTVLESTIPSSYTNLVTNSNFIATGGDIATSINEPGVTSSLRIYPNPIQNDLWIERKEFSGGGEFVILSLEGKILSQGRMTGTRQVVNVSSLAPGCYILKMNSESRKFVKE